MQPRHLGKFVEDVFQIGQVIQFLEDAPKIIDEGFDGGIREHAGQHRRQRISGYEEQRTTQRTPLKDATLDREEEELLAIEIRKAAVVSMEGFQKPY